MRVTAMMDVSSLISYMGGVGAIGRERGRECQWQKHLDSQSHPAAAPWATSSTAATAKSLRLRCIFGVDLSAGVVRTNGGRGAEVSLGARVGARCLCVCAKRTLRVESVQMA